MTNAQAAGDPVGSFGEEAVKLLSAMSAWAQDQSGDDPGPGAEEHGPSGTHVAACHWCPVCQAVSAARSASPELKAQLVTSGLALTTAARMFLETLAAPPVPGPPAPDVEHIDLTDDGGAHAWD